GFLGPTGGTKHRTELLGDEGEIAALRRARDARALLRHERPAASVRLSGAGKVRSRSIVILSQRGSAASRVLGASPPIRIAGFQRLSEDGLRARRITSRQRAFRLGKVGALAQSAIHGAAASL